MRANVSFHATMIDGAGNPLMRNHVWLLHSTWRSAVLLGLTRMRQRRLGHVPRAGDGVGVHNRVLVSACTPAPSGGCAAPSEQTLETRRVAFGVCV
jgi:hypothetical protein